MQHAALLLSSLCELVSRTASSVDPLDGTRRRILNALIATYSPKIQVLLEPLSNVNAALAQQALALEALEVILPFSLRSSVVALFADLPAEERLKRLNRRLFQTTTQVACRPQRRTTHQDRLIVEIVHPLH